MNGSSTVWSRGVALLLLFSVVLATLPGVATAATRSGGTMIVPADETVRDDLQAYGGTVIVRGTVDGDLEAFAGNVYIDGAVTGDVEAAAGTVRISGSVGGSVEATAGNVEVEDSASIGGNLEAAAGNIVVAGSIGGDARLAGGSITLTDSASIDGDVAYAVDEAGQFSNEGAVVGGTVAREEAIQAGPFQPPRIPGWTFGVYGFFVNLTLGAILLLVVPTSSRRIADGATARPLRSVGVGLVTLIGVPVFLTVVALTIIGIPIAIIGLLLYALFLWIAVIYGRFAIGVWLLSTLGRENRWLALLVGMVLLAMVNAIPIGWIGGVIEFVVLLLGLGAMTAVGYGAFRGRGGSAESTGTGAASR